LATGDDEVYRSSFTAKGREEVGRQMQGVFLEQKTLKIIPNPAGTRLEGVNATVPVTIEITLLSNKKEVVPSEFKLVRSGNQWQIDNLVAVAPFSMPGAPPWVVIPQGGTLLPAANTVRSALNAIHKKDQPAFDAVFAPSANEAAKNIWGSAMNARSFAYELPDDLWQEQAARGADEVVLRFDLIFVSAPDRRTVIPTDFRLKMTGFHEFIITGVETASR
jgi:hypothetical protein